MVIQLEEKRSHEGSTVYMNHGQADAGLNSIAIKKSPQDVTSQGLLGINKYIQKSNTCFGLGLPVL